MEVTNHLRNNSWLHTSGNSEVEHRTLVGILTPAHENGIKPARIEARRQEHHADSGAANVETRHYPYDLRAQLAQPDSVRDMSVTMPALGPTLDTNAHRHRWLGKG